MNVDGAWTHISSVPPSYPHGETLRLGAFQRHARSVSRRLSGGVRGCGLPSLTLQTHKPLKKHFPGGKEDKTDAGSRERSQVHQRRGPPPPRQLPALQRARGRGRGTPALVHQEGLLAVGDGLLRHRLPALPRAAGPGALAVPRRRRGGGAG